jgi:hypothetical protein
LQNYRHGETRPKDGGSEYEENNEGTTPNNELDQEIQGNVGGKSEGNDDIGNSEQDEPEYGPEDGLEDKMARFSFQSDERLMEVRCYDVVSGKVE